jgi:predicted DNA-binding transcriptional regulator AlpA
MSVRRFLSKAEVRAIVQLSYSEIARREKRMMFPSRLRLGPHRSSRSVWIEDEIAKWIDEQIAKRRLDGLLVE